VHGYSRLVSSLSAGVEFSLNFTHPAPCNGGYAILTEHRLTKGIDYDRDAVISWYTSGDLVMQKLRPYIIPGLFLFHLVMLCVMIFTGYDPNSVKDLLTDSPPYAASLLSQFLLTALWAGLGSGPWALRIPGCGALTALSWIGCSITLQQVASAGDCSHALHESPLR